MRVLALLFAPLVAAALLAPRAARADVVMPRPETCPPGAVGQSSHRGPYCKATSCATDADCGSQRSWSAKPSTLVCRPAIALCVASKDVTPPRAMGRDGRRFVVPAADVACGPGGECPAGATCETASRCVDPSGPPPATPGSTAPSPASSATTSGAGTPRGCACRAAGGDAAGAWAGAAMVLCAGALASRRRVPPRRRRPSPDVSAAP